MPVVNPSESIAAASMLDSRNFVLYDSSQKIIWQSFENPTDTLLAGLRLRAGQDLISSASETDNSKGIFRLYMQPDGYLVQYPVDAPALEPYAYWATKRGGLGSNVSLNLDDDSHLYLFNSSITIDIIGGGYPRQGRIYLMRIDVDGIFWLYSHSSDRGNWSMIWQSSGDKCDPKGICGINSVCMQQNSEADCNCLPGFDFVDESNRRAGCERNFTVESCKNVTRSVSFKSSIKPLDNLIWVDEAYAVLERKTREECEKACLEDCNCEAAFFKDGNCRKQRLPMRYGRQLSTDPNIALIKVGVSASFPSDVPSDYPRTTDRPEMGKKKLRLDVLIIGISLIVSAVLILGISGVLIHRSRVWAYKKIYEISNAVLMDNVAPRSFAYRELQQATGDFKEELGKGAFGTVCKGVLPDNQMVVAVKRLDKALAEGETEFHTEIRVIGKTHHRNLVRLLGFCCEGPHRLLVYEYMSNGSLANILFKQESKPSWEERIRIALDVARGILYLHEECETQIIHCDIKPQNILIGEHRCAKISDFGLAKLLQHDQTRTYTAIRGTKGYVAPEWHKNLPVTVKADVYSFGTVLLEIVCCRRNVELNLSEDEAILNEWAYACFEAGELQKLVGDQEVDKRKLERMVKIAIWCTQEEPSLRPSMKKVLLMLEGTVDIPVPPSPTSFLSSV